MQFRIFAIPATGSPELEGELNLFLRSHRITSVQRTLETWEGGPRWCFCVEYMDGSPAAAAAFKGGRMPRVDYREVLSEADFNVYAKLRDIRKELATAEAVPVFTICNNDILAEIAKTRPVNMAELKRIHGFGEAKAAKYGEPLLKVISAAPPAADAEKPDAGAEKPSAGAEKSAPDAKNKGNAAQKDNAKHAASGKPD